MWALRITLNDDGPEQLQEVQPFTLKDLLSELAEVEWYEWRASDLDKKAQAAGNVNSVNSSGGHYSIQSSVHSSQGGAKARELHSKPGVKLLQTLCLAKGRPFDKATIDELCAGLALQRGQTLDDLLPLSAENVAVWLASPSPAIPELHETKESASPGDLSIRPDGIYPPNSIRSSGRDATLQPLAWRLLGFMWEKESAALDDVCQEVWGDPENLVADRAVKNAIGKVNSALQSVAVPWRLGIKSGHVVKKSLKSLQKDSSEE